jgi:transaldolase
MDTKTDLTGVRDRATRLRMHSIRATTASLWRVEREFREFLLKYRNSAEYRRLQDGARLRQRFEEAGFGDFFDAPDGAEWRALRKSKLPDLDSALSARLAVDTHMSLLADGDFVNQQEAIDAALLKRAPADEEADAVNPVVR